MSGKKEKQKRFMGRKIKRQLRRTYIQYAKAVWKEMSFFQKLSWGFSVRRYAKAYVEHYINKNSKWRKL